MLRRYGVELVGRIELSLSREDPLLYYLTLWRSLNCNEKRSKMGEASMAVI